MLRKQAGRRGLVLGAALLVLLSLPINAVAQEPASGPVTMELAETGGLVHQFDISGASPQVFGEGLAGFQTVFPPDDRIQITPTTSGGWSAIALTAAAYSSGALEWCTAAFIGPDVLLTAAHCLYDPTEGGWAAHVAVGPGNDGAVTPYGVARADKWWVPEGWRTSQSDLWDWGLIKMPNSDLGNKAGWLRVGVLNTDSLMDPHFGPTLAGYPSDKPFGTMWASTQDAFNAVDPATLYFKNDAVPGESGSPVWGRSDHLGNRTIVGVLVRQGSQFNEASRIDRVFLDTLLQGCSLMKCGFDYYVEPSSLAPFTTTWARTDKPVSDQRVSRTWMWGPQAYAGPMVEGYTEAPGTERTVVYFDKTRMEITDPNADPNSLWYVTNGLLAKELITGRMQIGNDTFINLAPAQVNIAGDPNDPNGPTYASFNHLLGNTPIPLGWSITQTVDRAGNAGADPSLASYGVTAKTFVVETNHNVASVFWDFMISSGLVYQGGQFTQDKMFQNPYYATGYPITEAYWTTVKVGGVSKRVLVQVFERRVLTYTPDNPDGWQVEAGNVGQHYYRWRYGGQ